MEVLNFRIRVGVLVFALSLLVYLLTLCPTVYWDDAGELIAACYTLGIPHPPGHPLYALLGKLFTLVPFGSIAWRVNLMSAFFGALSSFLVYLIIGELLNGEAWNTPSAAGGALFFAFAPIVWDQATIAETSTLHSFFMMALTLLAVRLAAGRMVFGSENKSLLLFGFLYGLSLTNHVAGVFFLPAFAFIFFATFGRRILAPRRLGPMLLAFSFGLLVYAYLPVRSLVNPPIDWGNPETLRNFIWVVTAQQYAGGLVSAPDVFDLYPYLISRGRDLLHNLTIVGCIFAAVGIATLYRRNRRFVIFCVLVIGVLLYIGLNSAFISAYFIPAMGLIAVWTGVGIWRTITAATEYLARTVSAPTARKLHGPLCGVVAAAFVLPLGLHYQDMDRSDQRYALHYGERLMGSLPENAAFFNADKHGMFILWYLIFCEDRRPDLMVVEPLWLPDASHPMSAQISQLYPELVIPSVRAGEEGGPASGESGPSPHVMVKAVMDANYGRRPIYWGVYSAVWPFGEHLVPKGIVYRYSKDPVTLDDDMVRRNREFWESELDYFARNPEMREDRLAREIYPVELNNQGALFENRGRYALAREAVVQALEFNPDYAASRYNLGRLYAREGDYEAAIDEYEHAVRSKPDMAEALYALGDAYDRASRLEEAFLAYRKATHVRPAYYQALTRLGELFAYVGQNRDAAEKFEDALTAAPTYVPALQGLVNVSLAMGDLERAKEIVHTRLDSESYSAADLYVLAGYYARLGEEEEAALILKRSIESGGPAYRVRALNDDLLEKLMEDSTSVADK
jgi:tetratricopeptide (TPR) repeat protein